MIGQWMSLVRHEIASQFGLAMIVKEKATCNDNKK
jgi:hypothetical protein